VYPCIGNHDTDESEDRDDRDQLLDSMFLRERIASDEASGRASVDPGLFDRFRYGRDVEFIYLDTSKENLFRGKRLFEYPKHWEGIEQTFEPAPGVRWRLLFCHHPPFCAGLRHHNTDRMECCRCSLAAASARYSADMSTTFNIRRTTESTTSSPARAARFPAVHRTISRARRRCPGPTRRISCS